MTEAADLGGAPEDLRGGARAFWTPPPGSTERTRMASLMRRLGAAGYPELVEIGATEPDRFWRAALADIGLEWYRHYDQVMDQSGGPEWTRWWSGGRTNLVLNCLDKQVRDRPGQVALISEYEDGPVRSFTYAELAAEVGRAAAALRALGVGRGDAVGLFLPMIPEVVIALLAVAKLGGIIVPLFSGYGAEAVAVRLSDARARVLVTADGFLRRGSMVPMKETADAAAGRAGGVEHVVVVGRLGRAAAGAAGPDAAPMPWDPARDVRWDEALAGQPADLPTEEMEAEDPVMLIYTSGTTGRPKGCVHVHGGFPVKAAQDMAHCFDFGAAAGAPKDPDPRGGDRMLWITDIGWMMGPWEIMGTLTLGGAMVTYEGTPDFPAPDRVWDMVERHQVTHLGISPTFVRAVMKHGEEPVRRHDMSSLRVIGSTGEPWNPAPWEWCFTVVGGGRVPILNYSGGTEISGGILCGNLHTPSKPCAFSGPVPGMAADVVDAAGRPVRGEVGELVLRRPWPGMTRGFWKDPERYLATYWSRWPGLWYHGDWAEIDEDGLWYILGRSDDTIKIAGKRVGPAEVESALVAHPAVQEAAAIGVPDELKGESLVAFVILRPGVEASAALEAELKDAVATALGKALKPKAVHAVADLPRTRNAKIMRRVIRAAYVGQELGDLTSLENPAAVEAVRGARPA
ncbi:MAG TPA: AMP-binding protein [Candidatus Dormibacteraeota bacterium]|nr:AMP-binding protein [Candidatus Dormibacteraeota bacterium]